MAPTDRAAAPTNDLAVFGFCELWALAFGFPPVDELYHGASVSTRMVTFMAIGGAFAVLGPTWPLVKSRFPRRWSASFVRTASDFRAWLAAFIVIFVIMYGPDFYARIQKVSVTPPSVSGFTQQQVDERIADATKQLKAQLDQANNDAQSLRQSTAKQIQDAVAKATAQSQAQSDTPISVDKLPTSLKLLFKAGDIEEIASQNVIWTKLVVEHEQKVTTLLGERSNTFPAWVIVLIFKKPITFKKIDSDDHGAGLPVPEMSSSSPRYAVIEFGTHVVTYSYQNVRVDITFK